MEDFTTPEFDRLYGHEDMDMLNARINNRLYYFYKKDGHVWCSIKKTEKKRRRQK